MVARKLALVGALSAVAMIGCNGSSTSSSAGNESELHGPGANCSATDAIDSLPDGKDEDCDGVVDEDVDFKKQHCPPRSNVILGTAGDDILQGTKGRDCILGFGGNDTISGGAGDDFIAGGPGDDQIYAGQGRDIVHGGAGADRIDAAQGGDALVYGGDGPDTLLGGNGKDGLFGGDGNDVIIGGNGPDLMQGGDCNDLLIGERAPDLATGGRGHDACSAEVALECEKRESTKVDCETDADCDDDGQCAMNVGFCVPQAADACNECVASATTDTTCNGIDDDCDGQKDEDFVASATACGAGACAAMGVTSCDNGAVADSCVAGAPAADDASCNGIDDDCDGLIDDDYASIGVSCGVGACASTGATSCVGGNVESSCMPGAAAADDASCDGVDDDCDGQNDEDYASVATSCGTGACASTGSTSCAGGAVVDSCSPSAGAASDASCNGVDDDCDGQNDEDYASVATSCGTGACVTGGATSCVAGQVQDSCTVSCEGACADTSDDDNDGQVDCADTDCASDSACAPPAPTNTVGQNCVGDADCSAGERCETALPGGYCYLPCDTSQPAGQECPSGLTCWLGSACVVPCGPGNSCGDARLTCGDFSAAGLPPDPFCHPTCLESCVNGASCDPGTNLCF